MVEEHTLCMLVNNKPGVLSRLAAVFSRQGYNIKTLCVAETTNADVSRVTLTACAESDFTEKIKKQINKLVDIIEVLDYTGAGFVHREMMLIGIPVKPQKRAEILKAIEIFGCKITTMSPDYYVLEITGSKEETAAVYQYLRERGANEVNRTGIISIPKVRS